VTAILVARGPAIPEGSLGPSDRSAPFGVPGNGVAKSRAILSLTYVTPTYVKTPFFYTSFSFVFLLFFLLLFFFLIQPHPPPHTHTHTCAPRRSAALFETRLSAFEQLASLLLSNRALLTQRSPKPPLFVSSCQIFVKTVQHHRTSRHARIRVHVLSYVQSRFSTYKSTARIKQTTTFAAPNKYSCAKSMVTQRRSAHSAHFVNPPRLRALFLHESWKPVESGGIR
jgi:hypothetical protein